MSIYLRKSLRAGPFRFNLSKSGLGVSVGVPGFRVGVGPRGNYVNVGGGGVYYRASLRGSVRSRTGGGQQHIADPGAVQLLPVSREVLMEDVTGASAEQLLPVGPGDLVQQLNAAAQRLPLAPWIGAILALFAIISGVLGLVFVAVGIPTVIWLALRDRARRSVVAFYDVHDTPSSWFSELVEVATELSIMKGFWRVNTSGRVRTTHQYKINAGASSLVSRTRAKAGLTGPARLVTNIAIPTLSNGDSALYFMPERILIRNGRRFSDVSYSALQVICMPERFIEDGGVPSDGEQVDTTWRYVNVKGGPDRRFNNNRKLPVMLYDRLELTTPSGLQWILHCSKRGIAVRLQNSVTGAPTELDLTAAKKPYVDAIQNDVVVTETSRQSMAAKPVVTDMDSAKPAAQMDANNLGQSPSQPRTYTGAGDDVVQLCKPSGLAVLVFECPKGVGYTSVKSDGSERVLVSTIGPYLGKRWIDAKTASATSRLIIKSNASWLARIGGIDLATRCAGLEIAGNGDDVVAIERAVAAASILHTGKGHFSVWVLDMKGDSQDLLVSTVDNYRGTVPLSGPALVQVTSKGSWVITLKM